MLTEAHYQAVLNFFYFLLLDEAMATSAALKTIKIAQRKIKADPVKKKDVVLIATMCSVYSKYRAKYLSRGLTSNRVMARSDWVVSKPDNIVSWKEFLRHGDAELGEVLVLRYILDFPPNLIAEALAVPEGTVFFRLGRGLEVMAESLPSPQVSQ